MKNILGTTYKDRCGSWATRHMHWWTKGCMHKPCRCLGFNALQLLALSLFLTHKPRYY